jgi:hypothetical protein
MDESQDKWDVMNHVRTIRAIFPVIMLAIVDR